MISFCFHDREVNEFVGKLWGSLSPPIVIRDRHGDEITLLHIAARMHTYLASPYGAGIALGPAHLAEGRADRRLQHLAEEVLEVVRHHRNLVLKVRIPGYFFSTHPYALLEPFLLRGFAVEVEMWERIIDLTAAPDEILARCTTLARRKMYRGAKAGVKCRVYSGEPVPDGLMQALYEAAVNTRAAAGSRLRHRPETYMEDRRRLIEQGKAALGVVEHDGFTGYVLALVSRELGFYFDGAWTGARSDFANHTLHYQMMLYLQALGCRRYSAGYVLPDLISRSDKASNIARFKHSLGADLSPVFTLALTRQTLLRSAAGLLRGRPVGRVGARPRHPGARA